MTFTSSLFFNTPAFASVDTGSALASGLSFALIQVVFFGLGIKHLLAGKKNPHGFRWGWSFALLLIFGGSVAVSTFSRTGSISEGIVAGVGVGVFAGLIGVAIDVIASVTWRKKPSERGIMTKAKSIAEKTLSVSHEKLTQFSTDTDSYTDSNYQQVAEEIERSQFDKGLWLKAQLKVNSHDETKIQMEYVKLRLEQISKSASNKEVQARPDSAKNNDLSTKKHGSSPRKGTQPRPKVQTLNSDRRAFELELLSSSINAENSNNRPKLAEDELLNLLKELGYIVFRVPGGLYRVEYKFQIVPCESSLVGLRSVLETHDWRENNY